MNTKIKINSLFYYASLVLIITLSFFLHSSLHYPLLNSDDALNVLMAHSYQLPDNFYCWGQDRGGTIIPLIAQIFIKLLGVKPIMAVSFANYLILILGYLAISSFFKSKFTRLIFAIAWFFPPMAFADLTRFPMGVQYSLLGMALYMISKINFKDKKLKNHLLMIGVICLFTIAIWVSTIAFISIIIIILTLYGFYLVKNRKLIPPIEVIIYALLGSLICYLFISYAQSYADYYFFNYRALNTPRMFWHAVTTVANRIWNHLTFNVQEPLMSIYSWMVLLMSIFLMIAFFKKKINIEEKQKKWVTIFFIDLVIMFGGLLMSRWVYVNYVGYWYFVITYISFLIVTLFLLDNLSFKKSCCYLTNIMALIIVIVGAFTTVYALKYVRPKTLQSQVSVRSELLTLGEQIGIVGNYWEAYISAVPDPERIKATPHENGGARNDQLLYEVFDQPKLYVIGDNWLDAYPDTLRQYGFVLLKKGEPFSLANSELQEYVRLKRDEVFHLNTLLFINDISEKDTISMISKDSVLLHHSRGAVVPGVSIAPGEFTMEYEINVKSKPKNDVVMLFEIVAEAGEVMLVSHELTVNEIESNEKQVVKLDFTTCRSYNGLESRIYAADGTTVVLTGIHLKER